MTLTVRYRWQDGEEPVDSPRLPDGLEVSVVVAEREVWHGSIEPELREWARRCALSVAHLWDAPPVVKDWLGGGNPDLLAWASTEVKRGCTRHATVGSFVYAAVRSTNWAIGVHESGDPRVAFVVNAAMAATLSYADGPLRDYEMTAQSDHLRDAILRKTLPKRLWPLIGNDERVLCDALLSGS